MCCDGYVYVSYVPHFVTVLLLHTCVVDDTGQCGAIAICSCNMINYLPMQSKPIILAAHRLSLFAHMTHTSEPLPRPTRTIWCSGPLFWFAFDYDYDYVASCLPLWPVVWSGLGSIGGKLLNAGWCAMCTDAHRTANVSQLVRPRIHSHSGVCPLRVIHSFRTVRRTSSAS